MTNVKSENETSSNRCFPAELIFNNIELGWDAPEVTPLEIFASACA